MPIHPRFVREERGKNVQPVLVAYIHASNYVNENMKYKVSSVRETRGLEIEYIKYVFMAMKQMRWKWGRCSTAEASDAI
jgi:hypothetical protein